MIKMFKSNTKRYDLNRKEITVYLPDDLVKAVIELADKIDRIKLHDLTYKARTKSGHKVVIAYA